MSILHRCAAALTSVCFTSCALSQLTPAREFYGVGRPIPMTVSLPSPIAPPGEGAPAGAPSSPAGPPDCEIALLSTTADQPVAVAPVLPGKVDLAAVLPVLWNKQPREVLFAQLRVGGKGVGAPVVLSPMLNQPRARAKKVEGATRPTIMFVPLEGEEDVYSGVQAWIDKRVVLTTDEGEIEIATRPDAAPLASTNFLRLVAGGLYERTVFHRVVPLTRENHPFVIQGGDPTGTGSGGCGYYVDLENSRLPHSLGVVSMARADDPDSNGSQFFVCLSREGTSRLDGSYAAFGVVTRGIETVLRIARTPLQPGTDKPVKAPMITAAALVDAPPMEAGKPAAPQSPGGAGDNPPR
ncbi:MAG TPA: peptidylprolyl isomerase [Phycisphaerales bacterium]|nr:peptidylprolyl isomerase [Phycisphaerales bacterium]